MRKLSLLTEISWHSLLHVPVILLLAGVILQFIWPPVMKWYALGALLSFIEALLLSTILITIVKYKMRTAKGDDLWRLVHLYHRLHPADENDPYLFRSPNF